MTRISEDEHGICASSVQSFADAPGGARIIIRVDHSCSLRYRVEPDGTVTFIGNNP